MSMTKRIIAVMVAAIMIMAMGVCSVSAAVVVDEYEVIEFGVFNAAGDAPDAIGADKTVTVKATLRRVAGANNIDDSVSVVAAVYSGTELVDVSVSTKNYTFAGPVQDNTVQLTIPAGKENLKFKAFLWDGDMITPLAKSSDEAEITGITIGGVEVEAFDADTTSYDVNLPKGTASEPEVFVEANGIIDADVAYDNGVATITAGDAVYTVNYTIAQPTLVASYNGAVDSNGNSVFPMRQVLKNPDATITGAADDVLLTDIYADVAAQIPASYTQYDERRAAYTGIEDHANRYFTDCWSLIYSVPEELVGKTRVVYDFYNGSAWNNSNSGANAHYWTITVDADTRIWYSSRSWGTLLSPANSWGCSTVTYLGADGVIGGGDDVNVASSVTDYGDDFKFYRGDRAVTLTATMADVRAELKGLTSETNPESSGYHKIYTADLILPEGVESATYIVGGHKPSGSYASIFCYEFLSEDVAPVPANITNLKYTEDDGREYTELAIADVKPELNDADFYDEATEGYTKTIKDAYGLTSNAQLYDYVTPAVSNRAPYWFYMDMPDKFVGMKTILIPYTNPGTVYAGYDSITLTTDKDIRLYVASTSNHTDHGAVLEGPYTFSYQTSGDGVVLTTSYADLLDLAAGKVHSTNIYSYDIIVPEGQTTATATIKVRGAGTWFFPEIFYEELN